MVCARSTFDRIQSLEFLHRFPAPPIKRLEVTCHCLKVNQIVIPLNFSTLSPNNDQLLQVTLEGSDLTGPNFTEDVSTYTAEYRPTCQGMVKAR